MSNRKHKRGPTKRTTVTYGIPQFVYGDTEDYMHQMAALALGRLNEPGRRMTIRWLRPKPVTLEALGLVGPEAIRAVLLDQDGRPIDGSS